MPAPITHTRITKIQAGLATDTEDMVAVEEPLEIRIAYASKGVQVHKSISVTMRTPGNDAELAAGFLFTEGIIHKPADIMATGMVGENIILVTLASHIIPAVNRLERNFYTTSSCGICGKASIDAIKTMCGMPDGYPYDSLKCPPRLIYSLPGILRKQQSVFEQTGGIHACAIFDAETGTLQLLREDVGRHNALDKLVGATFISGLCPLDAHLLLLSGRASFELVQKAAMAGIKMIAAVGAPSSLAVQMAEEWNITLIGFLRGERFNIYSGGQRVG